MQNLDFIVARNLPYSVTYGNGEEHIVIVGATHGNEPAGVNAIAQYTRRIEETQTQLGGVVTFAVGNPAAYKEQERYLNQDLNRSFTSATDKQNTETGRAHEIALFLAHQKKLVGLLDLHSVSQGNFKMVAYNTNNPNNKSTALAISPLDMHFAYDNHAIDGLLLDKASQLGAQAIAIECGGHQNPEATQIAIHHIDRFLLHFGFIPHLLFPEYQQEDAQQVKVYQTIDKIIPTQGFTFKRGIISERPLRNGESYANDDERAYFAPQNCYVIMPSKNPKPTDYDAGFLCTRELITR